MSAQRLPDCAGQAADGVSACTEERMENAPKSVNIPKSESVQKNGFVFHEISRQSHGQLLKILGILLERNLFRHPFAGLL